MKLPQSYCSLQERLLLWRGEHPAEEHDSNYKCSLPFVPKADSILFYEGKKAHELAGLIERALN